METVRDGTLLDRAQTVKKECGSYVGVFGLQ